MLQQNDLNFFSCFVSISLRFTFCFFSGDSTPAARTKCRNEQQQQKQRFSLRDVSLALNFVLLASIIWFAKFSLHRTLVRSLAFTRSWICFFHAFLGVPRCEWRRRRKNFSSFFSTQNFPCFSSFMRIDVPACWCWCKRDEKSLFSKIESGALNIVLNNKSESIKSIHVDDGTSP